MNRILQIVLAGVIAIHFIKFCLMAVSLPLMFRKSAAFQHMPADSPSKGVSIYSVAAGPARLSVESTSTPGTPVRYFGFTDLAPSVKMNDDYFIYGANNELIKVRYDAAGPSLLVPVTEKKFNIVLWTCIVLMVAYMITLIYLCYQLFRFARETGKQHFFTPANKYRLRLIGWFILALGLAGYLLRLCAPTILEMVTGANGLMVKTEDSFLLFPGWIIAGLLLLIIAEAFGKGFQLQQEQDYTI